MTSKSRYKQLEAAFKGEFFTDDTMRKLYATDASAYRELPEAVAYPGDSQDVELLIALANNHQLSLIPRTAGTSLAGQVVGKGIVVDVSKYFNRILEVNQEEGWVMVEPGVVRDELNRHLQPYQLFFGPETSTANRAMIGGMVGNNSCGSNSVIYGSTREHLLEVHGFLSDGSPVVFSELTTNQFVEKCELEGLEGDLYRQIRDTLSKKENQETIRSHYPKPTITRRNTGYALDLLMDSEPFGGGQPFNFCKLIAGSEGTLVFITKIKLHVNPSPPVNKVLICAHFSSIYESLQANLVSLKYNPSAVELMDHHILERTKDNIEHRQNRFFVDGDPQAILVTELQDHDAARLDKRAAALIAEYKENGYGYHYPVVHGDNIARVWSLRKAGLGLLSNIPGDAKPVPVIEDTAVDVEDLPAYIEEFNEVLAKYGLSCVHYAHAGSGELHLRPILNLKAEEGNRMFKVILEEIAQLVKKYKGSLSGEHGDGRLRGEFISYMIGDYNYQLLKNVKAAWDPKGIFNPGKIVDTPSMNTSLRFRPGQHTPDYETVFDFSENQGVLRAAEQCNGSGDCRKSELTGGVMCPSYMVTKNEKDTTRARANILREVLTDGKDLTAFANDEIKEVMDLCLSCKGCKAECPSNVDLAKLKAEFLHHYQTKNGVPLRSKMIGNFAGMSGMAIKVPWLYNLFMRSKLSAPVKALIGFHPKRSMPALSKQTVSLWYGKHYQPPENPVRSVWFFIDEFTEYNDAHIGITAMKLLVALGIDVKVVKHAESGRSYLSKGMLTKAKGLALKNVNQFAPLVSSAEPLIGVEPSTILTFRDEYLDLLRGSDKNKAKDLSENVFTIDEYLANILKPADVERFTKQKLKIKLHGHCYQKALSSQVFMKKVLSIPKNYTVELIPSGCCGMAGSFGYEKEHFEVSMDIGELVLFPTVRNQPNEVQIAAPGTSCRHQILDGTGKKALHPVEILYDALIR